MLTAELAFNGTIFTDELEDERSYYIVAHPDDHDVQTANDGMRDGNLAHVAVATVGELGENLLPDDDFVRSGKRELESKRALPHVKIPEAHQKYLGFPDGYLHLHEQALAEKYMELITGIDATRVVTMGAVDLARPSEHHKPHLDHLTAHAAAVLAVRNLVKEGYDIELVARNAYGTGVLSVPSTWDSIRSKFQALTRHESQMPIRKTATPTTGETLIAGYAIDREFWDKFPKEYKRDILKGETYDILRFSQRTLGRLAVATPVDRQLQIA